MRTINCEQGSPEWLTARMGIVTASELDALISPLYKVKDSNAVDSYIAFKLAEKWQGHPIQTFSGGMMEQGKLRESEAIAFYEFQFNADIKRVGFVTTDDGRLGASPDGMFADGTGLEIKCPEPQKHLLYLFGDECPKEYRHQPQGSMFATGAKSWRFMSYCPGFPPFIKAVEQDNDAMEAIAEALDKFYQKFEVGWQRLLEVNGGPPTRKFDTEIDANGDEVRTLAGVEL